MLVCPLSQRKGADQKVVLLLPLLFRKQNAKRWTDSIGVNPFKLQSTTKKKKKQRLILGWFIVKKRAFDG